MEHLVSGDGNKTTSENEFNVKIKIYKTLKTQWVWESDYVCQHSDYVC